MIHRGMGKDTKFLDLLQQAKAIRKLFKKILSSSSNPKISVHLIILDNQNKIHSHLRVEKNLYQKLTLEIYWQNDISFYQAASVKFSFMKTSIA